MKVIKTDDTYHRQQCPYSHQEITVNPVRKGWALNPTLNKERTFFSPSPP
jgi:hypothetical protein